MLESRWAVSKKKPEWKQWVTGNQWSKRVQRAPSFLIIPPNASDTLQLVKKCWGFPTIVQLRSKAFSFWESCCPEVYLETIKDSMVHCLVIQLSASRWTCVGGINIPVMLNASKLYKSRVVFQSTLLRLLLVSEKAVIKTSHVWRCWRTTHRLYIKIKWTANGTWMRKFAKHQWHATFKNALAFTCKIAACKYIEW